MQLTNLATEQEIEAWKKDKGPKKFTKMTEKLVKEFEEDYLEIIRLRTCFSRKNLT